MFLILKLKVFKYGVFSGPYFPVFSPNTGKYGPGKTPYLDLFHEVREKTIIYVHHLFFVAVIKTWLAAWSYSLLLLSSGVVELNP